MRPFVRIFVRIKKKVCLMIDRNISLYKCIGNKNGGGGGWGNGHYRKLCTSS